MENELLGIGRMATLSSLTVSALRFYDGVEVLVPAAVNAASGYRRYHPDQVRLARLIGHLRRVGMPVAEIRAVVLSPESAEPILDRQLARLEAQLVDARREFSIARSLLKMENSLMVTLHTPVAELLAALADVRFAVSADPELPMLGGVLFDVGEDRLRLVATDRFRMALSAAPATAVAGAPAEVLVPASLVDKVIAGLAGCDGSVTVEAHDAVVSFRLADKVITGQRLEHDFPNYRPWTARTEPQRIPIDVPALRAALMQAPTEARVRDSDGAGYQLSLLCVSPDGITVPADPAGGTDGLRLGVNREFLLEALAVGRGDQLMLELDGPIGPLTLRNPELPDSYSLLMPVRLD
jgi:DNA polymerase III subunit beta